MSVKNLIKKDNKWDKEYMAVVESQDDPLKRGRLQVKIDSIMGDIPFWVNSTLQVGCVNFYMVPDVGDVVNVRFRNRDVYSGEWDLKGSPSAYTKIDPQKYGMSDVNGNFITMDRRENNLLIHTVNDTYDSIGRNYEQTIEKDSTVTIKNDSSTTIKNNSTTTIENNSTITIENDSTIEVKNNSKITIKGSATIIVEKDANITVSGNTTLTTNKCDIVSPLTNLGVGGKRIARIGDEVEVDGITHKGRITSAGVNTSI